MTVSEQIIAAADAECICQSLGIRLGRRSGDSIQMLCPFPTHQDKHFGNCILNPKKKVFYCFACAMGGSVIDLVMLHNGWDPSDKKKSYAAMEEICSICGIDNKILDKKKTFKPTLIPPSITKEELDIIHISNAPIIDSETGETIEYSPISKLRLEDEDGYVMLILNKAKEAADYWRSQLAEELAFALRGHYSSQLLYLLSWKQDKYKQARAIEDKFLQYLIRRSKNGKKDN